MGISGKQYLVSGGLARNCRFFLSSIPATQPSAAAAPREARASSATNPLFKGCGLAAKAGDFLARHFIDRAWRIFRRHSASALSVVAPGAAFLPRGL